MKIFNRLKDKLSPDNEKGLNNKSANQKDSPSQGHIAEGHTSFNVMESNPKEYNFRYLQDLISPGESEIKLDHDIVLGENEEAEFQYGIMVYCNIDGNGHTIDARGKVPIFNLGWQRRDIIIKNLVLRNGQALGDYSKGGCLNIGPSSFTVSLLNCSLLNNSADNGGAIYNEGILNVEECRFEGNSADRGGAIYNESYNSDKSQIISINDSNFINNASQTLGDVIYNQVGEVSFSDCKFEKNKAKGMISNLGGNLEIYNCEFSNNVYISDGSSLLVNNSILTLENSKFLNNTVMLLIYNETRSASISYVEFSENFVGHAIANYGQSCDIKKTIFKNNKPLNGPYVNIINDADLTLDSIKADHNGKTILNQGNILIKNNAEDIEDIIDNQGTVDFLNLDENKKYFGFLDFLIHESDSTNILLEDDISFGNHEIDFYEGGIELDIDDLVIDGNGHIIDGRDKSRIFLITGKNITLKNIVFINGHSFEDYEKSRNSSGGSLRIYPDSNLIIDNCQFIKNVSEKHGGAIQNNGETKLLNSRLNGNSINPFEKGLDVFDISHGGGALYNDGKLTVINSLFYDNEIKEIEDDFECCGGAVYNDDNGNANLSDVIFLENNASSGGAFENRGNMNVQRASIQGNQSNRNVVSNYRKGHLLIENCEIKDNSSKYDYDIIGEYVEVIDCKLDETAIN